MNTQLVNRAAANIQNGTVHQPVNELNDQAASFVNDLFKSLQIAYPAWRQAFMTDRDLMLAKKSWIRAFAEGGISQKEQVALGMQKARQDTSDFFPSSGKFIAWCKPSPEDLGLPNFDAAYREACNNAHSVIAHRWSHPAVYQAGKETGWFKLRSEQARYTRPEFKAAYADICERVMRGDVFAVPKPVENALEHHGNGKKVTTEQSKAAGRKALAGLKGVFKVGAA